jgi:O-acetyl-ADP-ribose deacetylase
MASIEIRKGDITLLEVDAIVNAANDALWMRGGVAGAIKRAGGLIIEEEAIKKGPVKIGEAVATTGGSLKAVYVIHTAVMGQDLRTDAAKIRAATCSALRRAAELGLKSIAFPALGTGVGGFPLPECAEIMISEAKEFSAINSNPGQIIFILYDGLAYRAFREELDRIDRGNISGEKP